MKVWDVMKEYNPNQPLSRFLENRIRQERCFANQCFCLLEKDFLNNSHNKNNTSYKTCGICGRKVYPGEGQYYGGRLIHRTCRGIAKIQRYRLNEW